MYSITAYINIVSTIILLLLLLIIIIHVNNSSLLVIAISIASAMTVMILGVALADRTAGKIPWGLRKVAYAAVAYAENEKIGRCPANVATLTSHGLG